MYINSHVFCPHVRKKNLLKPTSTPDKITCIFRKVCEQPRDNLHFSAQISHAPGVHAKKEVVTLSPATSLLVLYVNKLKVNFGKMTHNVLINLFKSYCCSFYSSHLWKFNSHGFDKICKSWNIAIRTLLQLPFNAHRWLLGPITEQNNIRTQLYIRNYRFLYYASRSSNRIVRQCINYAMYNSNSDLGYKFAFYRYAYDIDISCTMKHAISKITGNELTHDQIALVKNLKTLLDFRSGYINIDGLTIDDVNNLMYTLSID